MRDINSVSDAVVDSAMKVHSALGPWGLGLLESAYEGCLLHELRKRGLKADGQQDKNPPRPSVPSAVKPISFGSGEMTCPVWCAPARREFFPFHLPCPSPTLRSCVTSSLRNAKKTKEHYVNEHTRS